MEIDKRSGVWLQCAIDVEMQHRGWVSIRCVRSVADASPERVKRMALDLYGPAAFMKPPPRTPAERQKDARTRRTPSRVLSVGGFSEVPSDAPEARCRPLRSSPRTPLDDPLAGSIRRLAEPFRGGSPVAGVNPVIEAAVAVPADGPGVLV